MIMLASSVPILAVLGMIVNQGLPQTMPEAAFFAAGNRQAVRPLFGEDAGLVRHAFQRGSEEGRRAYFDSDAAHEAAIRSLKDRGSRQMLLGDMSLAVWLRSRASAWEQSLLPSVAAGDAERGGSRTTAGPEVFVQSLRIAVQSVLPLTALLLIVLFVLLRDRMPYHDEMALGIVMSLVGMAVLTSGIRTGVAPMGLLVPGFARPWMRGRWGQRRRRRAASLRAYRIAGVRPVRLVCCAFRVCVVPCCFCVLRRV